MAPLHSEGGGGTNADVTEPSDSGGSADSNASGLLVGAATAEWLPWARCSCSKTSIKQRYRHRLVSGPKRVERSSSRVTPEQTYGGTGKSLRGNYPLANGGVYAWGLLDIAKEQTRDIWVRFRARMPSTTPQGLKFLKVFGGNDGGYANTTFGLDYTGVERGGMYCLRLATGPTRKMIPRTSSSSTARTQAWSVARSVSRDTAPSRRRNVSGARANGERRSHLRAPREVQFRNDDPDRGQRRRDLRPDRRQGLFGRQRRLQPAIRAIPRSSVWRSLGGRSRARLRSSSGTTISRSQSAVSATPRSSGFARGASESNDDRSRRGGSLCEIAAVSIEEPLHEASFELLEQAIASFGEREVQCEQRSTVSLRGIGARLR